MKARPILQAVDFGEDVAEHDAGLARYFIETSSFRDVVNDRVDFILGEKGSGKTAILRHLAEPETPLPELENTEMIRAFNPQGNIIFRQLCERPNLSEQALRLVWMAYVAALLGNHLIERFWHETNLRPLKKILKSAGLLSSRNRPEGVWALMDNVMANLEMEGEVSLDVPKLPIKPSGRIRWGGRAWARHETVDLEQILRMERDLLTLLERRAWLLFDRLDEAFTTDHDLERLALRSLLRTTLDVGAESERLRLKCFLRTDVLERITEEEGFVNATHLRRHHLHWDREGIIDLVARRIAAVSEVTQELGIESAQMQTRRGRLRICHLVLPNRVGDQDLFGWIEQRTCDARKRLNPRNVISLLVLARRSQLSTFDRDNPDYVSYRSLISEATMQTAAAELSEHRLNDTVLSEFSQVRLAVEAMRGKAARMSRDELAVALKMDPASPAFGALVTDLVYCGLVSTVGDNVLAVPLLYRPALDVQPRRSSKGKTMSAEEERELEERAIAAVDRLGSGASSAIIDELDNRQSDFVVRYVRRRFPEVAAQKRKGIGRFALRRVELRAKRTAEAAFRAPNESSQRSSDTSDLAMVTAVAASLVDVVERGAMIAISPDLGRRMRRALEQTPRTMSDGQAIGMVAWIEAPSRRSVDGGQAVFARDTPGDEYEAQEQALEQPRHAEAIRIYVNALAEIVAERRAAAHLRPMGPLAVAEAITELRRHRSVTYRFLSVRGGTTVRLVILPSS